MFNAKNKHGKDVKLVAACVSNDEKAWAKLIITYKPICKIIARQLNASHCIDDIFSEFILKLLGTSTGKPGVLRQYHGGVSLKTFLSTVFRHMIIDYHRKKKIKISTKTPIEKILDPDLPVGMEHTDAKTDLCVALNLLSDYERKIIELYYYHNLTLRNISKILNCSKSKVSRNIQKIRDKLRKELEDCHT